MTSDLEAQLLRIQVRIAGWLMPRSTTSWLRCDPQWRQEQLIDQSEVEVAITIA